MTVHEHVYKPRGGCKEVMEAREDEVLVSGPAGTGKSRACLEKIMYVCLMTPGTKALMLRRTARSLASTALETWRNYVIPEALLAGDVVYYGGSDQKPPQYLFSNGSTVFIGGLDNPTRIMSSDYDIIYVQEATEITTSDIQMIKTRLRNGRLSFQQLLMDCNPAAETHPLKQRCNDKTTRLIESRHEDNPILFNEDGTMTERGHKYIEGILDKLTGVLYKRLRLGLWVIAEGVIYEEFDPAYHVLEWQLDDEGNPLPLPMEWPRYWVIDFGYVHPFVLKCYAQGDDGELYMYREIYMSRRTVAEHCKTIMSIVTRVKTTEFNQGRFAPKVIEEVEWIEPKPSAVICDHDAEDRRTFERETGLGTIPAIKHVSVGIDKQKERLKLDERGMSQFYLMADCLVERDQVLAQALRPTRTQEEYPAYVWKLGANGKALEEPVKEFDDGMDCDRYMTMFLDFKGKARATQL